MGTVLVMDDKGKDFHIGPTTKLHIFLAQTCFTSPECYSK